MPSRSKIENVSYTLLTSCPSRSGLIPRFAVVFAALALIDGIALPPRKDLYKIDFDKVLGPDKFPHTRKAAAEENAKVKALRVALLERRKEEAGETSGRQGSVAKRKRKRDDSDSEEESDDEEEEEEEIVAPPPKKRKRQTSPQPLDPPSRPKKKPGRPRKQADDSTSSFAKPKPAPKKRQPRASTSTSSSTAKIAKPASPRKSKLRQSVVNVETTGDPDGYESSDLSSVESSDEEEEEEKPKRMVPSVKDKRAQVGKTRGVQKEMKEEELEGPDTEAIEEPEQAVETPPSAESMDVDTEDPKPEEEVVDSQTSTSSWLTGGLKKVFSWLG